MHLKLIFTCVSLFTISISFSQKAADYYKQASALKDQKKYEQSLELINKALAIDSTTLDYYNVQLACMIALKQYKEAYHICSRLIDLHPDIPELYNNRGTLLQIVGEFDASIDDFTTYIEQARNDTIKQWGLLNRSTTKLYKRDFTGAYNDLMIAYKIDSTNVPVLSNLGIVCGKIEKDDQAIYYLLKAVSINPKYSPAYGNIGFRYQRLGEYQKSIDYYNKVEKLNPDDPLVFSNRSYSKLKLGDINGAITDITKSLAMYPENSYAYRIRALIYIQQKQLKKACSDLQTALDRGFTVTYGDEVIQLKQQYCHEK